MNSNYTNITILTSNLANTDLKFTGYSKLILIRNKI